MQDIPESAPSVLLVEDDDAVRRSIQLLLRSSGYEVRSYASALNLARDPEALRCSCLIADLMMPNVDAITLLGELRTVGWMGKALLISGFLDPGWEDLARGAGYEATLSKPISDSVLVRTARELLKH